MSNEQEKQAAETVKEALKKGFNYDLTGIKNRIADSLTLITIKAGGFITSDNEDFAIARESLMNARAKEAVPGKPVESVTSFAEASTKITRELEKNSSLFSPAEKAEILQNITEKRQFLENKLKTPEGIQSLILQNLITEAITNLAIPKKEEELLLESISNSKVIKIVNGKETEEIWSLPSEILTLLTPGNNEFGTKVLKDIFKLHLTRTAEGTPRIDLDGVSQEVKNLIAKGINKDPNRATTREEREIFGNQMSKNASRDKAFTPDSIKAVKEVLSKSNISFNFLDSKEFKRHLTGYMTQILEKNQKSTPQMLETKIKKGLISAVGAQILRDTMPQEPEENAIKNFTKLITKAKVSLETLVDPEFKKRILGPKGKIDLKKLDVKTLQNIDTELDATRQGTSPSTPVLASQQPTVVPSAEPNIISTPAAAKASTIPKTLHLEGASLDEESSTDHGLQAKSTTLHHKLPGVTTTETSTDSAIPSDNLSPQQQAKDIGKSLNKFKQKSAVNTLIKATTTIAKKAMKAVTGKSKKGGYDIL